MRWTVGKNVGNGTSHFCISTKSNCDVRRLSIRGPQRGIEDGKYWKQCSTKSAGRAD